jgi:ParB-like chromosome segregation protein Spo0J
MNIFCVHSELVQTGSVKEHPKNTNRHDIMQIALLADVIRLNGWRKPIVVSKLSGFVVKGHCRLAAAKKLGLEHVPVEYQAYASETEELADMVADNRVAEFAQIDEDALNAALGMIRESDLPVIAAGFRDADFSTTEQDGESEEDEKGKKQTNDFVQKGSIGSYQFSFSIEEQNAWLAGLYAKVGNNEPDVVAEIRRRLGL